MNHLRHSLILALTLTAPFTHAAEKAEPSMLRITCADEDVGAEVTINGKFKGECPLDMKVMPGTLKLRVVKKVDDAHDRIFEQDIRMGEGIVKKVEAILTTRLNAAGQRMEDERQRKEIERQRQQLLAAQATISGIEMVSIPSRNYEIGKYEVTQRQWKAVMGSNPSYLYCEPRDVACQSDDNPVEQVSWNDIQGFLQKLNAKTGKQYRLPTEAEWEYACYGGSKMEYCGSNEANAVAWYDGNSNNTTHPVGQKQANGYGLYDMSGNVWEWVDDCWEGICDQRVLRGGSWYSISQYSRAEQYRYHFEPSHRYGDSGFRLARTLP